MNPFLGVFFHWLGGFASGSFYVPYRFVKKWAWETAWLVGGFFSWIIMPTLLASLMTHDLHGVILGQSSNTLLWTYLFGCLWGLGGLTFGLTMRYLGMSLGMGVALGYCAAFGTLLPPIAKLFIPAIPADQTIIEIASTLPGRITLFGVFTTLVGIALAAYAGFNKEQEMSESEKTSVIKEFNFPKGIMVATFSGVMSACFAFGLTAGTPIKIDSLKAGLIKGAREHGISVSDKGRLDDADADMLAKDLGLSPENTKFGKIVENYEKGSLSASDLSTQLSSSPNPVAKRLADYVNNFEKIRGDSEVVTTLEGLKDFSQKEVAVTIAIAGGDIVAMNHKYALWQGLPVLIVVLIGGFTTNFIWCVLLNFKNKTGYQYLSGTVREEHLSLAGAGGGEHGGRVEGTITADLKVPLLKNYFFSALAGTIWYLQFFFYTMGESQMGRYSFASWTLHMASIIIFSTMWGWIFHEWKGSSKKTHLLIALGIATLILSTIVIGYGTWLKGLAQG
jgi:hypothetical protein